MNRLCTDYVHGSKSLWINACGSCCASAFPYFFHEHQYDWIYYVQGMCWLWRVHNGFVFHTFIYGIMQYYGPKKIPGLIRSRCATPLGCLGDRYLVLGHWARQNLQVKCEFWVSCSCSLAMPEQSVEELESTEHVATMLVLWLRLAWDFW